MSFFILNSIANYFTTCFIGVLYPDVWDICFRHLPNWLENWKSRSGCVPAHYGWYVLLFVREVVKDEVELGNTSRGVSTPVFNLTLWKAAFAFSCTADGESRNWFQHFLQIGRVGGPWTIQKKMERKLKGKKMMKKSLISLSHYLFHWIDLVALEIWFYNLKTIHWYCV